MHEKRKMLHVIADHAIAFHQTTQNRAEDSPCRLMSSSNSAHNSSLMALVFQAAHKQSLCIFINDTWNNEQKYHHAPHVDVIDETKSVVCSYENFQEMQCQLKVVSEIFRAREKRSVAQVDSRKCFVYKLIFYDGSQMWVNGNVSTDNCVGW